ncbi:MAG TPA: M50 family metallopeptidase [Acidimicrobiales bacterium]|nr:M50 family metallopeptidase [Acidimicrobiales bacterium]
MSFERFKEGVAGGYSSSGARSGSDGEPDPAQQRRSLLVLLGVVGALVILGVEAHFLPVLAAIAVIAAVIMLHELGHFTAAKASGMKVTEYFLGFGPRLWSVRKGETEYGIKAIPAGGYVRILGMNNLEQVDPADEPRTYRQASFPRRLAVAVAGSTVHFVLALVTVWALFGFGNWAKPTATVAELVALSAPSPAQAAGFQKGDRIITYDGHPANNWEAMHVYIEQRLGQRIEFVVSRHGQRLTLDATPGDGAAVRDQSGQPISTQHVGFLGIVPSATNYSLLGSVPHAFRAFWDDGVVANFKAIGTVFGPHGLSNIGKQVASAPGSESPAKAGARPVSVVGIVEVAGQLHGWASEAWLFFIANAFVGVLNLLPILPFDGGHVAIAVYEAVRSRRGVRYRADVNKMVPYAMVVMALIVFVGVSSLYLDILHPVTLH